MNPVLKTPVTAQPSAHRLSVPGADLYYEVRGSGPLLLVIGQPMTSGPFGPLADLLADRYTVVTYDPHGLGQSTVEDPALPVTPEVQADDLALLIGAVGGGPADVFATSGGAVAALALAVRHPDTVRTVVAHEPPVAELLPDAALVRAAVDDIEDTYRSFGSGAAWGRFVSLVIHNGPLPEEGGVPQASWPPAGQEGGGHDHPEDDHADEHQAPAPTDRQRADDELFFLRMLKPFTRYRPEVDRLRTGGPRVVVGLGSASEQEIARRSTDALASQLGTPLVTFPGDHAGFMAEPAAFATILGQLLAGAQRGHTG